MQNYDIIIIAVEVIIIIALIFFVRKFSKERKELMRLEEENAIKMREQMLKDRLANDKRR